MRLEFLDGGAEFAMGGGVAGQCVHEAADFLGAEGTVAGDRVADVEAGGCNHGRDELLGDPG
jgi:hypothetical protein